MFKIFWLETVFIFVQGLKSQYCGIRIDNIKNLHYLFLSCISDTTIVSIITVVCIDIGLYFNSCFRVTRGCWRESAAKNMDLSCSQGATSDIAAEPGLQ